MHKGLLIVVSGPSGCGKGSLVKRLLERNKEITFSVSATTRSPRNGEAEGQHYYFKTEKEFKDMIEADELIEWVEYCGNYYGTPIKGLSGQLSNGQDVILEVEVEGAMNVKRMYPDCVLVFILPPALDELRRRIEKRGTEKGSVVDNRIKRALEEIRYAEKYDYLIVNKDISQAVTDMEAIIKAEKLKMEKNSGLIAEFEKQLKGVVIKSD